MLINIFVYSNPSLRKEFLNNQTKLFPIPSDLAGLELPLEESFFVQHPEFEIVDYLIKSSEITSLYTSGVFQINPEFIHD